MVTVETMSEHTKLKSNWCGQISEDQIGTRVSLAGWVSTVRDLGGIIFVELRDRSGLMQIVSDPNKNPQVHSVFETLKDEFVISINGIISQRPQDTYNPNLPNGTIEIYPESIKVLNTAITPPFMINDDVDVNEDLRLKYRYLDLRRPSMLNNLTLRHKITTEIRNSLNLEDFLEVETPILIKTTPEGARDYLVPSRVQANKFYALPQSPQIFKQLLMVSGVEKYYQIARCFRDEDLRSDRQPEFTQVDVEMSFVDTDDVLELSEKMLTNAFAAADIQVQAPFKRMTYRDAMDKYGCDRPDTRFGLELFDVSDVMQNSSFTAFADVVKDGGTVRAISIPNIANYSRKDMDDIRNLAISLGAKGLAWITFNEDGTIKSPVLKFLTEEEIGLIQKRAEAKPGDVVFFLADKAKVVLDIMGRLRLHFGEKLQMIDHSKHDILWVMDFPMYEQDEATGRLVAVHHPFTAPKDEDLELLDSNPLECRAKAYDVIYNGNELGGGSIRIHSPELQAKNFKIVGLTEEEISEKFGFMIDAFKYGAPPHGGIALGLDRLVALILRAPSIRDVIAFPKNSQAKCLMTDAPAVAAETQLRELYIKMVVPKK